MCGGGLVVTFRDIAFRIFSIEDVVRFGTDEIFDAVPGDLGDAAVHLFVVDVLENLNERQTVPSVVVNENSPTAEVV